MTVRRTVSLFLVLATAACTPVAAPRSNAPPSIPGQVAGPTATPLTPPTLPPDFNPSPTGCPPLTPVTGPWPSDRLEAVEAIDDGYQDLVSFRFAEPSTPGSWTTVTISHPTSDLIPGEPDEPVDIQPGMTRIVRIEGLGDPATFTGARDIHADLTTVGQVKLIEETEDSMTWAVGAAYACLSLRTSPADRTIAIGFSHGVP